tara:strand:- start:179 stop:340 length:162 start_codon:yes stop_codon:yes gene_type:complete
MEVELLQAVALVSCVYVIARIMNHVEHTKRLSERENAERERLKKIAALYGRDE